MAQISVRVDDAVKRGAEQTFNDIGLSMNAAITVFLKACAREKRIPFELTADPFILPRIWSTSGAVWKLWTLAKAWSMS